VYARTETHYTYVDGNALKITCQLTAGDYAALIDMSVERGNREDGWELLLGRGVKIGEAALIVGRMPRGKKSVVRFTPEAAEPVCYLSPWVGDGWFGDSPAVIRLELAGRSGELQLSVRDSGDWVAPQPLSVYGDFTKWTYEMIPQIWSGWPGVRLLAILEISGPRWFRYGASHLLNRRGANAG